MNVKSVETNLRVVYMRTYGRVWWAVYNQNSVVFLLMNFNTYPVRLSCFLNNTVFVFP